MPIASQLPFYTITTNSKLKFVLVILAILFYLSLNLVYNSSSQDCYITRYINHVTQQVNVKCFFIYKLVVLLKKLNSSTIFIFQNLSARSIYHTISCPHYWIQFWQYNTRDMFRKYLIVLSWRYWWIVLQYCNLYN